MRNNIDLDLFQSLLEEVEISSSTAGGLGNVSDWVIKNLRHPMDWNKHYSFHEHEWQIDVLNDTAPHVYIRKATQVSASTVGVILVLAIAAKLKNTISIYTMPSLGAAAKLVASRVDPFIKSSPRLDSLVDRNVDSTSLKKISNSFVYFSGSANTNSAISVPARALFVDELAFSNPEVISTYTSRLGHNKPGTEIVRMWSSPLHPHSDISAYYEMGDQRVYMCFCMKCSTWVDLDPLECLMLPGYDDALTNIMPSDLDQPGVSVEDAWVKCPSCHQPISQENLCLPSHRAWVPRFASRHAHSYDVTCLCLPAYRTPQKIFSDLRVYRNTIRWSQYSLGVPSANASEQIMEHVIDNCFTISPAGETERSIYGASVGVDIGATSHLTAGKVVNGVLEVFRMEKIVQDGDNRLKKTIVDRFNTYRAASCCIDAQPDVSIVSSVQSELPYNSVVGAFFIRGKGKSALTIFELDEASGVIKVARTRAFDAFVEDFNKGAIKLPKGNQYETEIKKHLQAIKRIVNVDNVGESQHVWISSTTEDHWTLSLLYLWLAAKLAEEHSRIFISPSSALLLGRAKMKTTVTHKAA